MTKPRDVTQEELEEFQRRFYVDKGGVVRVKEQVHSNMPKVNQPVGSNSRGYLKVAVNGKLYGVHRIAYYLETGVWPFDNQIDHIDGNKSNNNVENLRIVTAKENNRSFKSPRKHSTSKYRGVSWAYRDCKWVAQIKKNGRVYRIGSFTCQKEAAIAYNIKALEFGFNAEALNKVF